MAVDAYGITKLQPDIAGGMKWEPTNWSTSRTFSSHTSPTFDPNDTWVKGTGDATYAIAGGQLTFSGPVPRLYIVNPDNTTQWRDVEVTCYFKVPSGIADAAQPAYSGMEAVARTSHGWFTSETVARCDSRGIDARMRMDGRIDFEKETAHPDSTAVANKPLPGAVGGSVPRDTWIGYKYLCYDLPNGNVKVELWMDTTDGASGGTWTKINEFTDDGTNMGGSTACAIGVDSRLRLTNATTRLGSESGIPNIAVYFRADNVGTGGLIYKKTSVREIDTSGTTPPAASALSISALNPSTTISFAGLNDTGVVQTQTQPSPPTVTANGGDGTITASWQVTSDGGSPITGWLVRAYPAGEAIPPATSITDPNARAYTFTGLANDNLYTVEVAAVNQLGASTFAATGATPVQLPVPPDPPISLTLKPLDTGALLNLTAPTNMGTGTLTGYQVTATDTVTSTAYLYSVTSLPSTLLGLPNDHLLSVETRTVTTDGLSSGATQFVTPTEHPSGTTPPDSPTGAVVAVYSQALGLTWTAGASPGTYPVVDYVILASAGGSGAFDHWYVVPVGTSATIGGLADDIAWTVDIWGRSAAGKSLVPLEVTATPSSAQAAALSSLASYAAEPPVTDPDPNPVYWIGYLPPNPTGVSNPDAPPPVPRHADPPTIFAFYPAGVTKADATASDGAFSPANWAGL